MLQQVWQSATRNASQVMGGCVVLVVLLGVLSLVLNTMWPMVVASLPAAILVLMVMWRRAVPEDLR